MRTLFLENGLPIFEFHEAYPSVEWANVSVTQAEEKFTDLELMDIIIGRIQKMDCEVAHYPMQLEMKLVISFPLVNPHDSIKDKFDVITTLAMGYKDDIIAGRVSIDRDHLFGSPWSPRLMTMWQLAKLVFFWSGLPNQQIISYRGTKAREFARDSTGMQ